MFDKGVCVDPLEEAFVDVVPALPLPVPPYALTLSLSGLALSVYHYQLQFFPEQSSSCGLDASCTYRWIEVFGFITIPLLALTSFAFISMILIATPRPWKTT